MADEPKSKLRLEIAHVLFIDIVGYSKLRINEQSAQIDTLREIVRGTDQFRVAGKMSTEIAAEVRRAAQAGRSQHPGRELPDGHDLD